MTLPPEIPVRRVRIALLSLLIAFVVTYFVALPWNYLVPGILRKMRIFEIDLWVRGATVVHLLCQALLVAGFALLVKSCRKAYLALLVCLADAIFFLAAWPEFSYTAASLKGPPLYDVAHSFAPSWGTTLFALSAFLFSIHGFVFYSCLYFAHLLTVWLTCEILEDMDPARGSGLAPRAFFVKWFFTLVMVVFFVPVSLVVFSPAGRGQGAVGAVLKAGLVYAATLALAAVALLLHLLYRATKELTQPPQDQDAS